MTEKYALIIIGIVAIVGIISLSSDITGRFTETYYENYCNPSACRDACGKLCAEYVSDTPIGDCRTPAGIVNGKYIYKVWSCD